MSWWTQNEPRRFAASGGLPPAVTKTPAAAVTAHRRSTGRGRAVREQDERQLVWAALPTRKSRARDGGPSRRAFCRARENRPAGEPDRRRAAGYRRDATPSDWGRFETAPGRPAGGAA